MEPFHISTNCSLEQKVIVLGAHWTHGVTHPGDNEAVKEVCDIRIELVEVICQVVRDLDDVEVHLPEVPSEGVVLVQTVESDHARYIVSCIR